MSKESYARGFCKAAEAAGVDPIMLVKLSQAGIMRDGPTVANARLDDFFHRGELKPNIPYSTPSTPSTPSKPYHIPRLRPIDTLRISGVRPEGGGLFKRIFSSPGRSVVRGASNAYIGALNSIFPGLGTGMLRLSSGAARRINSLLQR